MSREPLIVEVARQMAWERPGRPDLFDRLTERFGHDAAAELWRDASEAYDWHHAPEEFPGGKPPGVVEYVDPEGDAIVTGKVAPTREEVIAQTVVDRLGEPTRDALSAIIEGPEDWLDNVDGLADILLSYAMTVSGIVVGILEEAATEEPGRGEDA